MVLSLSLFPPMGMTLPADDQEAGRDAATQFRLIPAVAVLYLGAPLLAFCATWFRLLIAVPMTFVIIISLAPAGRAVISAFGQRPKKLWYLRLLFSGVVAISFAYASFPSPGALQPVDAAKHQAIYHDLVTFAWPVVYEDSPDAKRLLRYSFGYYLIPAGISKIAPPVANFVLVAWAALGTFIFLVSVTDVATNDRATPYMSVVIAVLFSGMSVMPALLQWTVFADFQATVLDAWSRPLGCGWLLGSQAFSLRWAPQHTIPSWIGASLLVFQTRQPWFWKAAPLIVVALLLWSPFVALSFVILGCVAATNPDRRHLLIAASKTFTTIGMIVVGALVLAFLTFDSAGIPIAACVRGPTVRFLAQYGLFVILSFGAFALFATLSAGTACRLTVAAIVLLVLLPFTNIGTANDLQMRASTLPFCVLLFATLRALSQPTSRAVSRALGVAVAVGCLSGLQELSRAAGAVALEWQQSSPTVMRLVNDPSFFDGDPSIEHQYIGTFPNRKRFSKILRIATGSAVP